MRDQLDSTEELSDAYDSEHLFLDKIQILSTVQRLDTIGSEVEKARQRGDKLKYFQQTLDIEEETGFDQINEVS